MFIMSNVRGRGFNYESKKYSPLNVRAGLEVGLELGEVGRHG